VEIGSGRNQSEEMKFRPKKRPGKEFWALEKVARKIAEILLD
jgi:hypothetical protein